MNLANLLSRFAFTLVLAGLLGSASVAMAQTVIVDEDFESYADNAALYAVWGPSNAAGELVDETFTEFITLDDIDPQDVGARAFPNGGQGVEHIGGSVLEYQLPLGDGSLVPTETESIVLQGDIFDIGAIGNKRMSIGLRSSTPNNLVELGHWNSDPRELAHRAILFESPPTAEQPNWQFYELPVELDRPDDADDVTTLADLGEAWHTHRVTITPTTLTYEIDLLRDGLDAATGEAGFDSSITYDVTSFATGYDSLRIGGPSGVSSAGNNFYGGVIFDNILLQLVDVVAAVAGDYNGNGTVDAADYTLWRDTLGDTVTAGEGADGNGNGVIDTGDYDFWKTNFGNTSGSGSVGAIPEPASVLLLVTLLGLLPSRRR